MAPEAKKPENKTLPVKLLKNYRPHGEFIVQVKNERGEDELRAPTEEEILKAPAGSCVHLPLDEAKAVIEKGLAKRNDPIA